MMLPRPLRSFKAIRKPGKNGPAVFAFSDPRPLLRDFTKNIDAKAKPSLHKPLGSRGEGSAKPMSSEPAKTKPSAPISHPWAHRQKVLRSRFLRSQPRRIGPGSAHWARPQHAEPYPTMPVTKLIWTNRIFCELLVRSCRLPSRQVKQQWDVRMHTKTQTGGCCRSTELLIVVPRPSWCNIFLQKTWRQRKAEKDETTKSFEQQPN